MAKKNKTIKCFQEVIDTIAVVGEDKTMDALKRARETDPYARICNFLIEKTCNYFNISVQTLKYGRTNTNRPEALSVCSYLLEAKLNLSPKQIGVLLGVKNERSIYRYLQFSKSLQESNFQHRQLKKRIKELETELDIYVKENNYKIKIY